MKQANTARLVKVASSLLVVGLIFARTATASLVRLAYGFCEPIVIIVVRRIAAMMMCKQLMVVYSTFVKETILTKQVVFCCKK